MLVLSAAVLLFLGVIGFANGHEKTDQSAYDKRVLMDLCQFIGVMYVRNSDNPECGYIACWNRQPFHMPCAPGLRVHPLFFWGDSYPCTEKDSKDKCNYIYQYMNGKAPAAPFRARTDTSYSTSVESSRPTSYHSTKTSTDKGSTHAQSTKYPTTAK